MKIAFLFPGYSSQYVGMGKELYDENRIVQEFFEEASNCLNVNFVKLCFASSEAELGRMNNAYTATFLVSAAIVGLLREKGIQADVVAGYNQGEYAALFAAHGISLPDGLYLLNKYGLLYHEKLADMNVSAIRVSGLVENILKKMINEKASIAIYETDTTHIVTGEMDGVDHVRDEASKLSELKTIDIDQVALEVGLHSSLMDPVVDHLKMYLEKVDFKDLTIPMIESIQGKQISHGKRVRDHVLMHIKSAIHWQKVMMALEPYDLIVEIGPGNTLSKMVKEQYPDKKILAVNKQSDVEALVALVHSQKETPEETEKASNNIKEEQ